MVRVGKTGKVNKCGRRALEGALTGAIKDALCLLTSAHRLLSVQVDVSRI